MEYAGKRIYSGAEVSQPYEAARIERNGALEALSKFFLDTAFRKARDYMDAQVKTLPSTFDQELVRKTFDILNTASERSAAHRELRLLPLLRRAASEDGSEAQHSLALLQDNYLTQPWIYAYDMARMLSAHVSSCYDTRESTTRQSVIELLQAKFAMADQTALASIRIDKTTSPFATVVWVPEGFLNMHSVHTAGLVYLQQGIIIVEEGMPWTNETIKHEELHIIMAPLLQNRRPAKIFLEYLKQLKVDAVHAADVFPSSDDALYLNGLQHELVASWYTMYTYKFYHQFLTRNEKDAVDEQPTYIRFANASNTAGHMFAELLTIEKELQNDLSIDPRIQQAARNFIQRITALFTRVMSSLEHRAESISRLDSATDRKQALNQTVMLMGLYKPSDYPAVFELPEDRVRV